MDMKLLILIVLVGSNPAESSKTVLRPEVSVAPFCSLLNEPKRFDGKIVRIRAIFVRGGEEGSELYCPKCLEPFGVYADFDKTFRSQTSPKLLRIFDQRNDLTLSVTVVGKFIAQPSGHLGAYQSQFLIMRAERVIQLPYAGRAPATLSSDSIRRLRQFCE
jgi:hypothetical protein